jgi:predicted RND superfamily exporter protein
VPTNEVDDAIIDWLEDFGPHPAGLPSWAAGDSSLAYGGDLGFVLDSSVGGRGIRIAWCKIRAASTLSENAYLPATQLRVIYNQWEGELAKVNAVTSSTTIGAAYQAAGTGTGTSNKYVYMTLQEAYVQMALTGAAIGLGIATVVLFLSTRNLIITIACIGTIAAALTCVIGTVVAMGWSLGSNESLCIMILTGFAVDYVVHLSHAYMESSAKARLERVHDALRDLGISVFWGMLTSVLAAAVLASCQIQFFHKFGVFFALTILFAYLWSVLFLMPLLAIIGPEPAASEDVKFGDQATASGDK